MNTFSEATAWPPMIRFSIMSSFVATSIAFVTSLLPGFCKKNNAQIGKKQTGKRNEIDHEYITYKA